MIATSFGKTLFLATGIGVAACLYNKFGPRSQVQSHEKVNAIKDEKFRQFLNDEKRVGKPLKPRSKD